MTEITLDAPAPGVRVAQPRRGFRYGAEAFWLAGFALEGGPCRTALELGTGSGVVALLLASRGLEVAGIDVRPEWGPLWAKSLAASTLSGSVELGCADVADPISGAWDLVVSNPPFFAVRDGPVSPDPWKRAARTESTATLDRFVRAALDATSPSGRAAVVVPVEREREVLAIREPQRWFRVGRRRSLFEFGTGAAGGRIDIADDGPEVRGWYRAVGARFARPAAED